MENFKIYILDPHIDSFFSNPISRLGDNFNAKYKFIIEEENWKKQKNNYKIYFLSSQKYSKNILDDWKKLNNISPNIFFKDLKNINLKKEDIVFISTSILIKLWRSNQNQIIKISKKCKFVIAINHYLWLAPRLTEIFNKLEKSYLLCERTPKVYSNYLNNEEENALEKHKVIEIPYMPNIDLKKCRLSFKKNKCAIIGQTHKLWKDHIFTKKTGYLYFHKLRNDLRKKYLNNTINKKIFTYYGPKIKIELNIILDNFLNINLLKNILKKLNLYSKFKNKNKILQKREITKYYKDTKPFKEIFREYSIILCGEEDILNLPVLGIFEAMMAGCIPLATLNNYYESLGMEKNLHYLEFNGTYEDAEKKILNLKNNNEQIDKMIENIIRFSDSIITPENSIRNILNKIKSS